MAAKSNLKLARDFINKKDFRKAHDAASQVVLDDPTNYNGHVFLGLANLELGDSKKSEEAYLAATQLNAQQPLAWQGLSKLYEHTEQWGNYAQSLLKLAELFSESADATKCAESIGKYIEIRRKHGTRRNVIDALSLLLETSPYYASLSTLPEPDPSSSIYDVQMAIYNSLPVLEEIIKLTEEDEAETINSEVNKRKTRIGAPPLAILRENVKQEIWSSSKLEDLYTEVLNHAKTSDDLRRSTEASLLQRRKQKLWSIPSADSEKDKLRKEFMGMVDGMVLINIPNELAWTLYFEAKDNDDLDTYSLSEIRSMINLLPHAPMAKMWKAWLLFRRIPEVEDPEEPQDIPDIDPLEVAMEAYEKMPDSPLLLRLLAFLNWKVEDYQNAIQLAESALQSLSKLEAGLGMQMKKTAKAINVIVGCSLVHVYPPKYHSRSLRILDTVLEEDANQVDCRLARGTIHETAGRWQEAKEDFDHVTQLVPLDTPAGLQAAEESAWCQIQLKETDVGINALKQVIELLDTKENETAQARAWWRLGKAVWDESNEDSFSEAYKLWIVALKRSSSFAPAYTSLGIYYADYAKPNDATRASKCFQKAFELDSREAEAARRLAEGFVDEQEWELAELVARRTIEGEGGTEHQSQSGSSDLSSRHIPTNVWAWKVVGIVAMNKKNYTEAIMSYQVALRTQKEDALLWLRLGEAYAEAGRHTAGLKALERSQQLDPDNYVCQFRIAEITRELGEFQRAIDLFDDIVSQRPSDAVLLAARGSTRLSLAQSQQGKGFLERAYISCLETIGEAFEALQLEVPGSRVFWKLISDAAFEMGTKPVHDDQFMKMAARSLTQVIEKLVELQDLLDARICIIIDLLNLSGTGREDGVSSMVAVASASYCVHLAGNDEALLGACNYDLAAKVFHLASEYGTLLGPERTPLALEVATDYTKRAIRQRSNEPSYWSGLGIIVADSNPKLSQHALIRAIQCEPKDSMPWCNLGLLYVKNNDLDLAQEAFHRAQVLDPDYPMSWVGQAIVAGMRGDAKVALSLLEHATSLSADMPLPSLEFAYRTFKSLKATKDRDRSQSDLAISAFFALERCLQRRFTDTSALHLASLISERLGLATRAVVFARRCASLLEAAYERTEDPKTARQYAITQSTLGRILLVEGDFVGSISAFDTVLSLVEVPEGATSDNQALVLRAQSYLGSGLGHLLSGEVETAVTTFETVLAEMPPDMKFMRSQVTVLLSQTMWMLGTDESREVAQSLLLESIKNDPRDLNAIVVLGAIAILLNDETLLEAAISEIISMSPQERRELDHLRKVDILLLRQHLMKGSLNEALEVAREAMRVDPENEKLRLQLVEILLQQSNPSAALGSLQNDSTDMSTLSAQLRDSSLAKIAIATSKGEGTVELEREKRMIEQAIFLAPWEKKNWLALAHAESQR
ncbi:TPR-like protein [Serendipita vermifera]|nr:TPR-like protein [Serendipita vermifera]